MKVSDMSSKCIEFENEANSAKEFSISLLKEINELKDEVKESQNEVLTAVEITKGVLE